MIEIEAFRLAPEERNVYSTALPKHLLAPLGAKYSLNELEDVFLIKRNLKLLQPG